MATLQSEASSMRAQLDAVEGPQEYLIAMLRTREGELKSARTDAGEARAALAGARQQVAELRAALQASESENQKVIARAIDHDAVLTTVKAMFDAQRATDAALTAQQLAGVQSSIAALQAAAYPSANAASRAPTPVQFAALPPGGSPSQDQHHQAQQQRAGAEYKAMLAAHASGRSQTPVSVTGHSEKPQAHSTAHSVYSLPASARASPLPQSAPAVVPPGASPASTRSRSLASSPSSVASGPEKLPQKHHQQPLFGAEMPQPSGIEYAYGADSFVALGASSNANASSAVRFAVSQVDSVSAGGGGGAGGQSGVGPLDVAALNASQPGWAQSQYQAAMTHAALPPARSPGEIKVRPLVRVAGQGGAAAPRWHTHTLLPLA